MSVYTIGDVKTGVQARGYGSDTAVIQSALINAGIRRITNMRRWRWNKNTSTTTVTVGNSVILLDSLSVQFDRVDAVRFQDTAGTYGGNLEYMEPETLNELQQRFLGDTGEPRYWTFTSDTNSPMIEFFPRTDKSYTFTVSGVRGPQTSDQPDGTICFSSGAPEPLREALTYYVCAELAARQRDWNAVRYWKDEYQSVITEIIRAEGIAQRQSPQEIGRWDGWENVAMGQTNISL